jgi:hypothetical protein
MRVRFPSSAPPRKPQVTGLGLPFFQGLRQQANAALCRGLTIEKCPIPTSHYVSRRGTQPRQRHPHRLYRAAGRRISRRGQQLERGRQASSTRRCRHRLRQREENRLQHALQLANRACTRSTQAEVRAGPAVREYSSTTLCSGRDRHRGDFPSPPPRRCRQESRCLTRLAAKFTPNNFLGTPSQVGRIIEHADRSEAPTWPLCCGLFSELPKRFQRSRNMLVRDSVQQAMVGSARFHRLSTSLGSHAPRLLARRPRSPAATTS